LNSASLTLAQFLGEIFRSEVTIFSEIEMAAAVRPSNICGGGAHDLSAMAAQGSRSCLHQWMSACVCADCQAICL